MADFSRKEMYSLIERLIEMQATQEEVARLEKLVISSKEARQIYVRVMQLHGQLYWDAAGAGSLEMAVHPGEPEATHTSFNVLSRSSRTQDGVQWYVKVKSLAFSKTVLLLLLVACFSFWLGRSGIQQNPQLGQNNVVDQQPGTAQSAVHNEISPDPHAVSQTGMSGTSAPSGHSMEGAGAGGTDLNGAPTKLVSGIPRISLPPVEFPENTTGNSVLPGVQEVESVLSPARDWSIEVANVPTTDHELIELINELLLTSYEELQVTPASKSTDEEWLRRASLDLIGRIPTIEETIAFQNDLSEDKRERLFEQLIQSRGFARHQGTVWTNLLVGRSRQDKVRRDKLQEWMSRQFRENRPWRETVGELIAAVGTQDNGPTNFLLAHLNNEAVPATAIATRILLCQQLQCAQCHLHPTVKDWGQAKFWEFNAFFQQCRVEEQMVYDPVQNREIFKRELINDQEFGPTYFQTLRGVVNVAYPRFGAHAINQEPDVPLRDQLADFMFDQPRPQAARAFVNRTWSQFMGAGFTNPVDDMGPHAQVSHPVLLETLTAAFVQSGYDVKRLMRWICLSDAYQLSSQPHSDSQHFLATDESGLSTFAQMSQRTLTAEQIYDSLLIATGIEEEQLFTVEADLQREEWLSQFYERAQTEENSDQSTFGGTFSQTLMMMNGELVQNATHPQESRFLAKILGARNSDHDRIQQISLQALSRAPSENELRSIQQMIRQSIRVGISNQLTPEQATADAYRDLYWAYLNSSEFSLIH